MQIYWQAKIWGLLHDPILKGLHDNTGRGGEGAWATLACMEGWVSPKSNSLKDSDYCGEWLKHIALCDLVASASDRAAIGRIGLPVDYEDSGIEIKHLLSGESFQLQLGEWHDYLMELKNRVKWLSQVEESSIPPEIRQCEDPRKVFWWLWRCYGERISKSLDRDRHIPEEPCLPLLPADSRIPDASLWSHVTMTSALAGALTGYHRDDAAYPKKGARVNKDYYKSRPHVAIFSFTPVQELIKASRKMRDFWAGSWILHYLSAKVAWAIAQKYGPDTLLYPCLYQQPLIDLWLLEEYPDFNEWIEMPKDRQLLTAGFPNVLVIILPDNGDSSTKEEVKNPVKAAMKFAEQTLRDEWLKLGEKVFNYLQDKKWMPQINYKTWDKWLECQWQTYWTALPLGDTEVKLHQSPRKEELYKEWEEKQNEFAQPQKDLLIEAEYNFVQATLKTAIREDWENRRTRRQSFKAKQPNLNVGSWWASIFDRTKFGLNAVKNCRNWELPTAFGPRSTISGLGPVVHPGNDWITEGETRKIWSKNMGLFDGIEELNATEVVKRGLHKILPDILANINQHEWYYPDLTSGVAGWLRQMEKEGNEEAINYYKNVCQGISEEFEWIQNSEEPKWGIPWIHENKGNNWQHPRLLNAGWAIEDFQTNEADKEGAKKKELDRLRGFIGERFAPGNNPTDWYVIAAGDGDGMGNWLKGKPLDNYEKFIPEALKPKLERLQNNEVKETFQEFLKLKKRMGPSTHSALSRALLDFSNQLLPYLTENRYAGRLIYGGGDDVLAYTNLWEWDSWLWDVRQCFKGGEDSKNEFENKGDYWRWIDGGNLPNNLLNRPLFTMGSKATISFGIVLAHHSVPLAIALENMWEAEEEAKEHKSPNGKKKDAVQVRVIYGNGNILKATAKFDVFQQWKELITDDLESAMFEQAATIWEQHPAPLKVAIQPWTQAFCSRRDFFKDDEVKRQNFEEKLASFIKELWDTTEPGNKLDNEVQNWLKLAAFVIRNREIKIFDPPPAPLEKGGAFGTTQNLKNAEFSE